MKEYNLQCFSEFVDIFSLQKFISKTASKTANKKSQGKPWLKMFLDYFGHFLKVRFIYFFWIFSKLFLDTLSSGGGTPPRP